ncbi:hypothetical protein FQA39_LY12844 [Lamprigera yunnana]|nr:hypothetical protein FQA39_LY12844 [Lamprigera yunnana]
MHNILKYLPHLINEPKPVLHSFAGYLHLKQDWLIKDTEILEAVFNHTEHLILKLQQGNIFAIDKATYSFANATVFGYDYGQVPQMPSYYSSNADLIKKFNLPVKNLATSDIFISSEVIVNQFINEINFPIELVEMEGTSYMQVAYRFGIPIISIKIVSDILNGLDNALSHDKYVPIAAKQINSFKSSEKNLHSFSLMVEQEKQKALKDMEAKIRQEMISNFENEKKLLLTQTELKYQNEIKDLEFQNESMKKNLDLEKENLVLQTKQNFESKIINLQNQNQVLINGT